MNKSAVCLLSVVLFIVFSMVVNWLSQAVANVSIKTDDKENPLN